MKDRTCAVCGTQLAYKGTADQKQKQKAYCHNGTWLCAKCVMAVLKKQGK